MPHLYFECNKKPNYSDLSLLASAIASCKTTGLFSATSDTIFHSKIMFEISEKEITNGFKSTEASQKTLGIEALAKVDFTVIQYLNRNLITSTKQNCSTEVNEMMLITNLMDIVVDAIINQMNILKHTHFIISTSCMSSLGSKLVVTIGWGIEIVRICSSCIVDAYNFSGLKTNYYFDDLHTSNQNTDQNYLELNLIFPTTIVTNSGLRPKFTIKTVITAAENPDFPKFIMRSKLGFVAADKS